MLFIRTDMNEVIATGHVMRCLAIADAARACGEETTFIVADEQAVALLEEKRYPCIVLHTQWDNMEEELPVLENVITRQKAGTLLIDSYQVTRKYLRRLSELVRTVYLDDLNKFVYPVTALICYASYWKKFQYENIYKDTRLFLGTEYAPLRREFYGCEKKCINATIETVLLLSGGTDPYHVLRNLLRTIDIEKYRRIEVVCGSYYSEYEELAAEHEACANIHMHKAVNNLKHYMQEADVVITAGGTTLYELCACGTPAISYAMADNQLDNVEQFRKDGIIAYAGDARNENVVEKVREYLGLYEDINLRRECSQKMQMLVDGKGAERIASLLREL